MANAFTIRLIQDRRTEIARLIAELQAEDSDLASSAKMLANGRIVESNTSSADSVGESGVRPVRGQQALVLAVLRRSPSIWMDMAEIAAALEFAKTPIKKSSLQPLLSKMRSEGVVAKDGLKVAIPERAKYEAKQAS